MFPREGRPCHGPGVGPETRIALPPGHVIHTMMVEHEAILALLDELERTSARVQAAEESDEVGEAARAIAELAEQLIGAEPHHQREEQVLFPALEQRGVVGPPTVMRAEHEQLRALKHELRDLAGAFGIAAAKPLALRLAQVVGELVEMLRLHIMKENEILYPLALQVILEKETWDAMKAECDRIGYCAFSPAV